MLGFLYPSTLDILVPNAVGACPVHCKMFSSNSGLLDASGIPSCDNQKRLDITKFPGEGGGGGVGQEYMDTEIHCP